MVETVVIVAIVGLALFWAVRWTLRITGKKGRVCCDASSCGSCSTKPDDPTGERKMP